MTEPTTPRRGHPVLRGLAWGATFVAFPIRGLLAMGAVGAVDDAGSAALGGLIVGAAIGLAQALGSRAIDAARPLPLWRWMAATSLGMGVGLAAGATAVGFDTSLGALAAMGAVTGVALGIAQAAALPRTLAPGILPRALWALATPVVLALGWTVTTLAGVGVDAQFAVFGATGAIVATALTGAGLWALARRARGASRPAGAQS